MKRKKLLFLLVFAIFVIIFSSLYLKSSDEVISFTEYSAIREISIDEKIAEAELIIIGEVIDKNPSKWKKENEKNVLQASPEEIFDAGGLFTDSIFKIKQILKGNTEEKTIRVRSYIGETNNVLWENSSEPVFEKKQEFLLFLVKDIGPTSEVDSGDYISVNSNTAVYQIVGTRTISSDDEWLLGDLIAYIQKVLVEPIVTPEITSSPSENITPTP